MQLSAKSQDGQDHEGYWLAWLQHEYTGESQTNTSVPQQEEQLDGTEDKVVADQNPDVDYKKQGSDPEIKAVNEEEENSYAVYVEMELT